VNTLGILPNQQVNTLGVLPNQQVNSLGVLPNQQVNTLGVLPNQQVNTLGFLPNQQVNSLGVLPNQQVNTLGVLPNQQTSEQPWCFTKPTGEHPGCLTKSTEHHWYFTKSHVNRSGLLISWLWALYFFTSEFGRTWNFSLLKIISIIFTNTFLHHPKDISSYICAFIKHFSIFTLISGHTWTVILAPVNMGTLRSRALD
jgi:hypothetical protein